MNLLALDTSSLACTVAGRIGDTRAERHEVQPREHTRLLMPMVREVLTELDCRLEELDAIVLGNGPGSFIGMRIAASVAQGLAFGAGLKIVPVSSLAAVAAEVFLKTDAEQVVVAQDAHMHEVYLGAYTRDARGDSGSVTATFDERLQGQSAIGGLDSGLAAVRLAAGAGWERYPGLYQLNKDQFTAIAPVLHPRARYLIDLSNLDDAIAAEDVAPAYLRQKVAQIPTSARS